MSFGCGMSRENNRCNDEKCRDLSKDLNKARDTETICNKLIVLICVGYRKLI